MAVDIPSDLVLDVMRAADPARLKAAVARLSPPADSGAVPFDGVLAHAAGAVPAAGPIDAAPAPPNRQRSIEPEFQQLVWRSLYEAMMPQEGSAAFGEGAGAGIWRSMAVDQLASVSAQTGQLDLFPGRDHAASGPSGFVPLDATGGWPYFVSSPIRSYAG